MSFRRLLDRLKDLRELILIVVFFVSGALWVISYFATCEELNDFRCINELTLAMVVNTMNAEYLNQYVRSSRRELKANEDLLAKTPKKNQLHAALAEQVDEQKSNLQKLTKAQEEASRTKESAFKRLMAIKSGAAKSCEGKKELEIPMR